MSFELNVLLLAAFELIAVLGFSYLVFRLNSPKEEIRCNTKRKFKVVDIRDVRKALEDGKATRELWNHSVIQYFITFNENHPLHGYCVVVDEEEFGAPHRFYYIRDVEHMERITQDGKREFEDLK